jgi:hypothetical protein
VSSAQEKIKAIQEERRLRKEALEKQHDEQHATDLAALSALEVEHGDGNVKPIKVRFEPGLPTLVVVRKPKPPEYNRYYSEVKVKANGKPGDARKGAEDLGALCLLYPPKDTDEDDTRARLLEARPGLLSQVGVAAATMAYGDEVDEGKD